MKRLTIIMAAAAIIFSCTDRTTSDGIRVTESGGPEEDCPGILR